MKTLKLFFLIVPSLFFAQNYSAYQALTPNNSNSIGGTYLQMQQNIINQQRQRQYQQQIQSDNSYKYYNIINDKLYEVKKEFFTRKETLLSQGYSENKIDEAMLPLHTRITSITFYLNLYKDNITEERMEELFNSLVELKNAYFDSYYSGD
jgi:hypothetical protein